VQEYLRRKKAYQDDSEALRGLAQELEKTKEYENEWEIETFQLPDYVMGAIEVFASLPEPVQFSEEEVRALLFAARTWDGKFAL
jgi:methyl coenzyme M reductase subunit C-like uncharacterized protein (methanogenesis marker protein 7)